MSMDLSEIVPLGRRADEYVGMFGLSQEELGLKILDCGGGHNVELVSVDYEFQKGSNRYLSRR